ncbi:MAG: DUF2802 domain-containing protein [Desulfobulbaceae bacterium]|nr:DUF2802 domain-containing protein [Desulfobulbaceae bacterium]
MVQINLSHLIAILPAILCLFLILLIVLGRKKNQFLSQQLTETTRDLEATRKKFNLLYEKHEMIKEFQNSLNVAELTTKLQKPRLEAQSNEMDNKRSTPGKYSKVQSLAKDGMSADQIASVLDISTHEAKQLVNLSKLAQGSSEDKVTG